MTSGPGRLGDHHADIDGEVLAHLTGALTPVQPSAGLWAKIDAAAETRPAFDWSKTINVGFETGAWEDFAPGVRRKPLWDPDSFLVSCSPGFAIPHHAHDRFEHCLLLEGEMQIADRVFKVGDYHGIPPGIDHPEIKTDCGFLLLVRYESSYASN